jgi:hypothetical protein
MASRNNVCMCMDHESFHESSTESPSDICASAPFFMSMGRQTRLTSVCVCVCVCVCVLAPAEKRRCGLDHGVECIHGNRAALEEVGNVHLCAVKSVLQKSRASTNMHPDNHSSPFFSASVVPVFAMQTILLHDPARGTVRHVVFLL